MQEVCIHTSAYLAFACNFRYCIQLPYAALQIQLPLVTLPWLQLSFVAIVCITPYVKGDLYACTNFCKIICIERKESSFAGIG